MEFVGLRNFRRLLFAREGGDAVLECSAPTSFLFTTNTMG